MSKRSVESKARENGEWEWSAKGVVSDSVMQFDIQSEYLKLASSFETLYFKDMEALGMRPATAVTRVSEVRSTSAVVV